MKIGFDAKRAFQHYTGLGNYSRNIIRCMIKHHPDHEYFLFTPEVHHHDFYLEMKDLPNVKIIQPKIKFFTSYWRRFSITKLINRLQLDVYHGLSNELPYNISKSKVKKIATIHDLIPFKEDVFRNPIEDFFYKSKLRSACKNADTVVSISKATANDIVQLFQTDSNKIKVIYQPIILNENAKALDHYTNELLAIKKKYQLPDQFLLQVGTVEYRKNIQIIIKAMIKLKEPFLHYVIVGKKTRFYKSLLSFSTNNGLMQQVHFIDPVNDDELACIYLLAEAVVYPSLYEGFGLPIVEAISFGKPVLTTKGGCFEEAGGPGAYYCNTSNVDEVATAITNILGADHNETIAAGQRYISQFSSKAAADALMNSYNFSLIFV